MSKLGSIPAHSMGMYVPRKGLSMDQRPSRAQPATTTESEIEPFESEYGLTPDQMLNAARVLTGISSERGVPDGQNRLDVLNVLAAAGLLRSKRFLGFTRQR